MSDSMIPRNELEDLFDPLALARQSEDDNRPETQVVTRDMVYHYVWQPDAERCELPVEMSARHFSYYAVLNWFDAATDSDGTITNGEVLNRLLADWRGNV